MSTPHLVGIDIDGTTLTHDGTLRAPVRYAVQRARDAGHHLIVSTGRAVVGTLPVLAELGLDRGYAVCSNGAVTIALDPSHPSGYEVLEAVTFDPAPALALLRDSWPDAVVAVEDLGVGFKVSAPFPERLEGTIRVVPWEDLAAAPVTRLTFYSPTGSSEDFLALAHRIGLHGMNYAVGYSAWLDINPEGVAVNWQQGPLGFFGSAYYMDITERSGSGLLGASTAAGANSNMVGAQIGWRGDIASGNRLTVAAAYFAHGGVKGYNNFDVNTGNLNGNTLVAKPGAGSLVCRTGITSCSLNDFDNLEVIAQWDTSVAGYPLSIWGDYLQNTSAATAYDTAMTAGFMIVPRHVLGRGFQAPSDAVNVAIVGINGMGASNARALMSQNIAAPAKIHT